MVLSNFLRATLPSGVNARITSTCNLGYAQVSVALGATTDGDILNCRAAAPVAQFGLQKEPHKCIRRFPRIQVDALQLSYVEYFRNSNSIVSTNHVTVSRVGISRKVLGFSYPILFQ